MPSRTILQTGASRSNSPPPPLIQLFQFLPGEMQDAPAVCKFGLVTAAVPRADAEAPEAARFYLLALSLEFSDAFKHDLGGRSASFLGQFGWPLPLLLWSYACISLWNHLVPSKDPPGNRTSCDSDAATNLKKIGKFQRKFDRPRRRRTAAKDHLTIRRVPATAVKESPALHQSKRLTRAETIIDRVHQACHLR